MKDIINRISELLKGLDNNLKNTEEAVNETSKKLEYLKSCQSNPENINIEDFTNYCKNSSIDVNSNKFIQLVFILESKLFINNSEQSQIKDIMEFFNMIINKEITILTDKLEKDKEYVKNYKNVIDSYEKISDILSNYSSDTYIDATSLEAIRTLSASVQDKKEMISMLVKIAKNNISIDNKQRVREREQMHYTTASIPQEEVTQNTEEAPLSQEEVVQNAEEIPLLPEEVIEQVEEERIDPEELNEYKALISNVVTKLNESLLKLEKMSKKSKKYSKLYLIYSEIIPRIDELKEKYNKDLEIVKYLVDGGYKEDNILSQNEGEEYNLINIGLLFNDAINSENFELLEKKIPKFLYYDFMDENLLLSEYLNRCGYVNNTFDIEEFIEENENYIFPIEPVSQHIYSLSSYVLPDDEERIKEYLRPINISFNKYLESMIRVLYEDLVTYIQSAPYSELEENEINSKIERLKNYGKVVKINNLQSEFNNSPGTIVEDGVVIDSDKLYPENEELIKQYVVFLNAKGPEGFMERINSFETDGKNMMANAIAKLKKLVVAEQKYFTDSAVSVSVKTSEPKYKTKASTKNAFGINEFRKGKIRLLYKIVKDCNIDGKGVVLIVWAYPGREDGKEAEIKRGLAEYFGHLEDYDPRKDKYKAKTPIEKLAQEASDPQNTEAREKFQEYINEGAEVFKELYDKSHSR